MDIQRDPGHIFLKQFKSIRTPNFAVYQNQATFNTHIDIYLIIEAHYKTDGQYNQQLDSSLLVWRQPVAASQKSWRNPFLHFQNKTRQKILPYKGDSSECLLNHHLFPDLLPSVFVCFLNILLSLKNLKFSLTGDIDVGLGE